MPQKHEKLRGVFSPLSGRGHLVDQGAVEQIDRCLDDDRAVAGALMADHHVGYSMPIGGVVAYLDAISPSGVGFDIACGNKAVKTPVRLADIDNLPGVMKEIHEKVSFGVGRKSMANLDHPIFDNPLWAEVEKISPGLTTKARQQLGTVGSGNHYVDLLRDGDWHLWVANHFGSRGFGHTIATAFLNLAAGRKAGDRCPNTDEPTVIDLDTYLGETYFELMNLAGEYAYAGRDYVIQQVLDILGTTSTLEVHNHHNFAWKEDGLIVVRKGATPLRPNELAFIGGSMGDVSAIVIGKPSLDNSAVTMDIGALRSAPHGAGRVMSRTKAAGKWKREVVMRKGPDGIAYPKKIKVRDASTGAVDWPRVRRGLGFRGITVLGSGADEAPEVYKELRSVLFAHSNITVRDWLHPVGVVMAGDDTFDPYKE